MGRMKEGWVQVRMGWDGKICAWIYGSSGAMCNGQGGDFFDHSVTKVRLNRIFHYLHTYHNHWW